MEVIFPDWVGHHPDLPDPRHTLLVPYPRMLPTLADRQQLVLDSGAFGRSFHTPAHREPLDDWFAHLAMWYRASSEVRWRVAPDVFGDPRATMQQYTLWHERYPDIAVAPVIQLWPRHPLDLFTIQQQAQVYGQQSHIMLSNPARMTAARWGSTLTVACRVIRQSCGQSCHIHLLGAGWSLADIRLYRQVVGLSSIDSIAYYTAAQSGDRWCRCCTPDTHWTESAYHHALATTGRSGT